MYLEQGHLDSERLQELLLKLDAIHFVDAPSVPHGPEYKTGMAQHVNKALVSNGNYVRRDQEESSNFMMDDFGSLGSGRSNHVGFRRHASRVGDLRSMHR